MGVNGRGGKRGKRRKIYGPRTEHRGAVMGTFSTARGNV